MFEKRLILQFKITFFGIFIKAMVNEKKCLTFPALSVKYYFRKSQHLWRGGRVV